VAQAKALGIFGKVFLYTTVFLIIVIAVSGLFFTRQISDVLAISQRQQLSSVFEPLRQALDGKTGQEAIDAAAQFHERNAFFEFCVLAPDGQILYTTPNYQPDIIGPGAFFGHGISVSPISTVGPLPHQEPFLTESFMPEGNFQVMMTTTEGLRILVGAPTSGIGAYRTVMQKSIIALVVLLIASAACAFFFARSIARPIKRLADNTSKMASLELVSAPVSRNDEIGRMANDVYGMYERLKETIYELEAKIEKQREMEESQRYFFAAASHELKTPVAATRALMEGMLEDVIPAKDYQETFRTCLRLANEQAELISEILELVNLNDKNFNLQSAELNLAEVVSSVLSPYTTLAAARAQQVEVAIPKDVGIVLDERLFKRALSNVIANALQNTPDEGLIRLSCSQQESGLQRLSIFNEGSSIPEEILAKLFEPFYQTDEARSNKQGRSGLGLGLVEKALGQMDIGFALENAQGGILFWMDLPQ